MRKLICVSVVITLCFALFACATSQKHPVFKNLAITNKTNKDITIESDSTWSISLDKDLSAILNAFDVSSLSDEEKEREKHNLARLSLNIQANNYDDIMLIEEDSLSVADYNADQVTFFYMSGNTQLMNISVSFYDDDYCYTFIFVCPANAVGDHIDSFYDMLLGIEVMQSRSIKT